MKNASIKGSAFLLLLFIFSFTSYSQQTNVNLGTNAGNGGTGNTSIGYSAGDIITGVDNIFIGYVSGRQATSATRNTAIGNYTAESQISGTDNVFLGYLAGRQSTASNNTFLGASSGYLTAAGANNTFLGFKSGYSNTTGSGNVFLGANAGYSETGSNKLYIDNSNTATPLIYGDFGTNQLGINTLPATGYALTVNGSVNLTAGSGFFINGVPVSGDLSFWGKSGSSVYNLNDNIGIGKTNPTQKLDVNGIVNASAFYVNGVPFEGGLGGSQWTTGTNSIYYNSNVGIGTANPDAPLTVNGRIHAKEVVVDVNVAPDYVFEKDYTLRPIEEVKAYIDSNKHLPEVPAAKVMEANGVQLAEMSMLLLKKVEELTLYIIQQDESIKEQNESIKKLESKIEELEGSKK
jgi:hypothetical protein